MWGGRFADGPSSVMREINASIPFDKRLWRQDIRASLAHVSMLSTQGIVDAKDAAQIIDGLNQIAQEYEADGVPENLDLEDIHMTIEARLTEIIGPVAGRLHTARSRNDQVATSFRLWVRDAMDDVSAGLRDLRVALIARAKEQADTIMPGFTHLQVAQPITMGHHLLAYHEMFARDSSRFSAGRERLNVCPLGAAALAGTGFPNDRQLTAAALDFDGATTNSMDSVSDRDFALDYLMAASQTALHLSRLAEEIIIWASQPFGFVKLSDEPGGPPVAAGRGAGALVLRGLPLRRAQRRLHHRQLDHAAETQSRCCRTGARSFGADCRVPECFDDDDERFAARLFKGHAGR